MSKTTTVKAATPSVIKLIDGETAIKKALASIKTRGATLQRDIHVACCSVLAHVGKHSDIRLVTELLSSLPDMTRKNAVKAWFEFFGPVTFAEGGDIKFNGANPVKLGDAMAKPFYAFKPEADYVPMDIAKSIDSLVKKMERDHKETGRDHTSMIAKLLAIRPEGDETAVERQKQNATAARGAKAPKEAKATPATAPAASAPVAQAA
ncbi:hypothetical protein FXV83_16245 [Bradyrhizobium hipponense]|uniref:Uncharacterized protein n=1 Tax=Bradyrhizobium hipponense TaxID=2605638 RepID=A0A5S4YQ34_9BRAD|nr:hypothetical protein [Bradyrhizobium hipponense]TYO65485.1 hypothetical protein FXV83_16245 [Bradyrhizobium hipponense]